MYDNNESRRLIWQGAGIRKLTAVSGRMKKRRTSSFSGSRKSKKKPLKSSEKNNWRKVVNG